MISSVEGLSKYFHVKSVRIYDGIFILHSKYTVALLLAASILLSARQFFGEPIYCLGGYGNNVDFVNSYCWTVGAYIINNTKSDWFKQDHYGLLNAGYLGPESNTNNRIYFRFYQWIPLLLLMQAVNFSLPAFLWKAWEGGRLKQLCADAYYINIPDDVQKKCCSTLVSYFTNDYRQIHFCYTAKYIVCEILNFLISVLNMYLVDIFFNGFWIEYMDAIGAIFQYNWNTWNRYTANIFPKVVKCEIVKYGISGSPQNIDVLCLLQSNLLNDKIFAFFWCWFLLMIVLAGMKLIYRLVLIFNKNLRLQLLRTQLHSMPKDHVRTAIRDFTFGDWFILYKMSSNINPLIFGDLIKALYDRNDLSSDLCSLNKGVL